MRNSTVSEKGVKSISILTTGHEKDRFTVMLACLGDGTKLPPYVIFKWKTLPKNMNFPKGVIVRCQEKGWIDQGLVQDWLRTMWSKVGALLEKSLCWYGIHLEPTCQHQFVARLSPWTPSPLLFLEGWQVWYSPWMLQSTSHLKIVRVAVAGVDAGRSTHFHCTWPYPQSGISSDLPVDLQGLGGHSKRAR